MFPRHIPYSFSGLPLPLAYGILNGELVVLCVSGLSSFSDAVKASISLIRREISTLLACE